MKYLRKKGRWKNKENKYVIEEDNKYIRTVPSADKLNIILKLYGEQGKPSQCHVQKEQEVPQTFAQPLLNESLKQDKVKGKQDMEAKRKIIDEMFG